MFSSTPRRRFTFRGRIARRAELLSHCSRRRPEPPSRACSDWRFVVGRVAEHRLGNRASVGVSLTVKLRSARAKLQISLVAQGIEHRFPNPPSLIRGEPSTSVAATEQQHRVRRQRQRLRTSRVRRKFGRNPSVHETVRRRPPREQQSEKPHGTAPGIPSRIERASVVRFTNVVSTRSAVPTQRRSSAEVLGAQTNAAAPGNDSLLW